MPGGENRKKSKKCKEARKYFISPNKKEKNAQQRAN